MQPVIRTPRLVLRPFVEDDGAAVQTLAGHRAVADTTLNVPHPYEDGMAEEWIASHAPGWADGELAAFAVTLADTADLVGAISLQIDSRFSRANLGYWVGKPYWNRGYCTEAAAGIVGFAFATLDLERVHASHLERNAASGRVMQNIGMTREGLLRHHTRKWGRFENLVVYGLLRDEWRRQAASPSASSQSSSEPSGTSSNR